LGDNLQVSDHLDLVLVHGAAIENPAVCTAVRSLQSISHQVNNDIIRKGFVLFKTSCQILSQLSITFTSNCILKHLCDLHVDKLVFLCNFDSLLFSAGAGWSKQDHSLRSARSLSPLQLQDACDLLENLLLALGAIKLCDEATADFLDTLHVDIALADGVVGVALDVGLLTLDDGVIAGEDIANALY